MQDDLALPKPKDLAPSDRLAELYIAGECTLAEQAAMERWINANPSQGRVLRALRAYGVVAASEAHTMVDVEAAERQLLDRIGDTAPSIEERRDAFFGIAVRRQTRQVAHAGVQAGIQMGRMRVLRWGMGAALACGVLIAGWVGVRTQLPVRRSAAVATYTTNNGQQATVTLADGSIVALGVGSRLDVSAEYATRSRVVRLSGEALFTVVHHDGLPFIVETSTSTTHVLGTTFLVRHYTTDSATTVAVRDGKVMVSSVAMSPTIVTATQQVVVSRRGRGVLGRANPAQFTFVNGVLTLDGVSLPAAIVELNRWYDVDLRLGDPALAQRHLKGEFAAGSLGDLVNLLELTFDVRVVRTGRILTLVPR